MAVTTIRTAEKINALIREIADKEKVRQGDVIRGMLYTGAKYMSRSKELPQELRDHYDRIAIVERTRQIKVETNFLASNAHFVKRSARMLLQTHSVAPKIAKEMYEMLKEEAELRGVLAEFEKRVPKNLDEPQEKSRALQEAKLCE